MAPNMIFQRTYHLFPILLPLLIAGACTELPVGGDPHRADFIAATVNGRNWASAQGQILAQRYGKALTITGIASHDGSELTLGIDSVGGTGSYPIDSAGRNHAAFITASSLYQTPRLPGSGTITLTRNDSAALIGTFTFTAAATSQSADTERVVSVRDGRFEIRYR